MSFVRGSNSALSSSSFFFSSSSSISRPSLVVDFSFFPSNSFSCCNALASNVIDVVLTFLHPINILLEADLLVARLRTVITHEFCNLCSVRGILVHAELQALAELLVKLLVIVLLLSDLRKHLQALFDQILLDHTQDLVLLKCLA